MCENLKPDPVRYDVCRTINLAKHAQYPKPDMQMYEKCTPMHKTDYGQFTELPLNANCIKVCSKEEYKLKGTKHSVSRMPHIAYGKFMYLAKAGVLVGAVYFTYTQGVWGDQQDVTDCIYRWQEYMRNTQRSTSFEHYGNAFKKESVDSLMAPLYCFYKNCVTTCFSGVAQVPLFIKSTYISYTQELKKKYEEVKERQNRKRS